jgi:hypothetical protein
MFQRVDSLRERPEKTKDNTELPSPTGEDEEMTAKIWEDTVLT